jgi:ADP-ribose pyrophosphatase YjhB (NUDIX family)
MKHRISAGVLVEDANRILLVRCVRPGVYDFWVAPGGGVDGTEDLRAAVQREAREECGLAIEPLQIAYVEDLWNADMRICKIWFTGRVIGGELTNSAPGASAEHIVDARFVGRDEFEGKTIFPTVLRDQYWSDKAQGFASVRYLGIREMTV